MWVIHEKARMCAWGKNRICSVFCSVTKTVHICERNRLFDFHGQLPVRTTVLNDWYPLKCRFIQCTQILCCLGWLLSSLPCFSAECTHRYSPEHAPNMTENGVSSTFMQTDTSDNASIYVPSSLFYILMLRHVCCAHKPWTILSTVYQCTHRHFIISVWRGFFRGEMDGKYVSFHQFNYCTQLGSYFC